MTQTGLPAVQTCMKKFAYYGHTNLTIDEVSDFAKQVFCGTRAQYSEIATKAYVDKLIQNLQS